jgi:uncharacterized lipoprotein YbaY
VKDLRAAIHKLEQGIVAPGDMEAYCQNVVGRLKHIERIHLPDGTSLRVRLEKTLVRKV